MYRGNGKEHANTGIKELYNGYIGIGGYILGLYIYMGKMEKSMETTGIIGGIEGLYELRTKFRLGDL